MNENVKKTHKSKPRKAVPSYVTALSPFARRLSETMIDRHITQSALAEKAGVQRQTISYYMNGQSEPTTTTLYKIADTLHVSADYLLGLSDCPSVNMDTRALQDVIGLSGRAATELECYSHSKGLGKRRLYALSRLIEQPEFNAILDDLSFCLRFGEWPTYFKQAIERLEKTTGEMPDASTQIILDYDRRNNRNVAIYNPQFLLGKIAERFVEESERQAGRPQYDGLMQEEDENNG